MKAYVQELKDLNLNSVEGVWAAIDFLAELTGQEEALSTYVAIQGPYKEKVEDLIYYYTAYHDLTQLIAALEEEGYFY